MKKIVFIILITILGQSTYAATPRCDGIPVAVLIDLSEPVASNSNNPIKISLHTLFMRIALSAPSRAPIAIFAIRSDAQELKEPDAIVCTPDFDLMKGEVFKARAQERYKQDILSSVDKVISLGALSGQSPILENIYRITHLSLLSKNKKEEAQGVLIVISDLIQNKETTTFNFYKSIPNYLQTSSLPKVSAWLPKAKSIDMHLITMPTPSSTNVNINSLRRYWLDYSSDNFRLKNYSTLNEAAISFKFKSN